MRGKVPVVAAVSFLLFGISWAAQGGGAEEYASRIKEYTTDQRFLNPLIDHLPASGTVPSPLQHFGTIIGAPDVLHYFEEINTYLKRVAEASPRMTSRAIGKTEEGREMVEYIIADESTIADLERYRQYLNRLADPRGLSEVERANILKEGKPIYFITGGLHSPETGSPEMLMELAYRLVVDESEAIREIRENVILIFVPVAEPDGRDRMVDTYRYRKAHNDVGPPLVYWGKYVAHDNNRDGYGLALALTRNILGSFLYWKPIIGHDLHESVPYLYISTGTGPYNEYIDPITVDEWHKLAYEEVSALTSMGMPGVWTHGFYTGWAANYLLWIANNRNAIGRFYETFGNAIPETKERELTERNTSKEWYRPNPPLKKTQWSLRNNVNYQQTGVLTGLGYVAKNRARFLENFLIKTQKAIKLGQEERPHAFVLPASQRRPVATLELVNLLRQQGLEVHRLTEDWVQPSPEPDEGASQKKESESTKESEATPSNGVSYAKGSFVVRLDQPYRTLARILLDKQTFPEDHDPPYDDTGWTLPLLRGVECAAVESRFILDAEMELLTEDVEVKGAVNGAEGRYFLVDANTEDGLAVLRFKLSSDAVLAAEESFELNGIHFSAGTLIFDAEANSPGLDGRIAEAVAPLGLNVHRISELPELPTHPVSAARVALVHTWVATPQNAGWWQLAFDRLGIPYTYLSEQDFADNDLSAFDVVILPNSWATTASLIGGVTSAGEPVPWKRSSEYPNIGRIDETDDVRKGMGYEGLLHLAQFVNRGGVLIAEGSMGNFAIETALARRVSIEKPAGLLARGTVLRSEVADSQSPITYGYGKPFGVHFSQSPVFSISKEVGGYSTPDWLKDEVWKREVPRVVLSFAKKDLLMSGMLRGGQGLQGKPAVIDVPSGKGHVVLFAIHPFWRWETHGSHSLVWNTILHWDHLGTGWPERPTEDSKGEEDWVNGDSIH